MTYDRDMAKEVKHAATQHPVVTILGPRQAGKTTLAKACFPNKPYLNLEELRTKEMALNDPVGFLDRLPNGAIIDEIQYCPELLSQIQVIVDDQKIDGMFILTGSYQIGIQGAVAQSLAGRTAILHLLPMSIKELSKTSASLTPDELLLQGGFPRVYYKKLNPTKTYDQYVQTYLERDLRQIITVKDLTVFQTFVKLCAGRIGQIFNKDHLACEVGVSAKTITHWISILEASYILFRLQPYHENFGKRSTKSPKLYFYDVGLASYLLGIENTTQMERDPLRGALFENLVILELIKTRWNQGLNHRLFFYRDAGQNEIDVLFQSGHQLIPIEIKSSKMFHGSFCKGIKYFSTIAKERMAHPCIIYSGEDEQMIKDIRLVHFTHAAKCIESIDQV